MKNKQPIVYVAREIYFNNGLGTSQEIARFVSQAHLERSLKEYSKDGDIKKEFLVNFDFRPNELYIDKYAAFNVDAHSTNSTSVNEIFLDYQSCKAYVDEMNKHLSYHIPEVSSSMAQQKYSIHSMAVEYGRKLEEEFISPEERTILTEEPSSEEDILSK